MKVTLLASALATAMVVTAVPSFGQTAAPAMLNVVHYRVKLDRIQEFQEVEKQIAGSYKIGMSTAVENRVRTLNTHLPRKGRLLHVIGTDDPQGVEQYWHRRFASRRIHGEWFRLDRTDIAAFKSRKVM